MHQPRTTRSVFLRRAVAAADWTQWKTLMKGPTRVYMAEVKEMTIGAGIKVASNARGPNTVFIDDVEFVRSKQ